jgi:hypothetical protein
MCRVLDERKFLWIKYMVVKEFLAEYSKSLSSNPNNSLWR